MRYMETGRYLRLMAITGLTIANFAAEQGIKPLVDQPECPPIGDIRATLPPSSGNAFEVEIDMSLAVKPSTEGNILIRPCYIRSTIIYQNPTPPEGPSLIQK